VVLEKDERLHRPSPMLMVLAGRETPRSQGRRERS
jgi:hypothetical protein